MGEHGETQAQTSLRQTLTVLRKSLAPQHDQILWADRQSVGLYHEVVEVDAVSFRDLVASGTPADLEIAVSLYRGDLLDDLDVPDPNFEAWLEDERRHFRDLIARALSALMACKRANGAIQEAIDLGQRLLTLNPLEEGVHRALMILYGELGQRQAALQQFQRCRELLASELGVEPEAETKALYQTLRNSRLPLDEETNIPDTAAVARPESGNGDESSLGDRSRGSPFAKTRLSKGLMRWAIAGLILVIGGMALFWMQPWAPSVEPASLDRMAFPLPDKPSIAVLPFANLSNDPDQDYFADGITDDLITELSRLDDLFVIARNSTFVYKGRAVEIRQVAEDLGVRYVLRGSVRRTDGRIRINAQMVDAVTGSHIWAERYDEPLTDIFAVQDRVTERVALALAGQLTLERRMSQARRETNSPEAYDALLRAKKQSRRFTRENFALQIHHLKKAIEFDPNYARAHAMLGGVYWEISNEDWEASFGMTHDEVFNKAKHHLKLAMQKPSVEAHYYISKSYSNEGRYDEAILEARKMIALNPNDVLGYKALGRALNKAGRSAESIEILKLAIRLDPRGDDQGWVSYRLGEAFYLSGRDAEAVEAFARSAERNQNEWSYGLLAASYAQLGRLKEAREALERFNVIRAEAGEEPFTVAALTRWPYKRQRDRARVQDGFRKAGMPEGASESLDIDWSEDVSPEEVEGAITIDVATAKSLFDRGVPFIDVRDSDNWNAGHIPGAFHLDLYEDFTESELARIATKERELVIIAHGTAVSPHAATACARAVRWGFKTVYYFRVGYSGWKSAGYPLQRPPN